MTNGSLTKAPLIEEVAHTVGQRLGAGIDHPGGGASGRRQLGKGRTAEDLATDGW